ncbi:thymidine phosphorylase family protein [Halomonas sp. I5-271120]|uniref:thymidine phosphorylase family protein n=1 Tax=Halomonas sp. I5-271120 TaxID=3061632 RepID=UPI002714CEBD|nr:thymidine phosphorylase family protein [Halomonas sp. I5-271120]
MTQNSGPGTPNRPGIPSTSPGAEAGRDSVQGAQHLDDETLTPLLLRRVGIDTYRENVAYLHRDCGHYRAEGFQALSKVEVRTNGHRILASLNVVDDPAIVACHQLGLSEDAFKALGEAEGHPVSISQAEPPASIPALHRKIAGERLSRQDFKNIIRDIAELRYSKIELTAFLVACSQGELDREEVFYLSDAMCQVGRRLDWHEHPVVDKHCIGGIPGNRTSMLVVPIVAAHGLLCPKTSSRAITSPSGTADTMEVLAKVDLPFHTLEEIVRTHRGCLAWGGTSELSPADDVLIAVERPLYLDSAGQMVASILSKKVAAGSTHLLLDLPVGPHAKVRTMSEARRLRKLFEFVAGRMGLVLDVVITDGSQPIGRGIGPVLEARDVMRVLTHHPDAPNDLRQKALRLAGRMLEFDPDVRGGDGFGIARDILDSGRALEKMQAIICAQGEMPFDLENPPLAPHSFEVMATKAGVVTGIDNLKLARIARMAGAPKPAGAGVDLLTRIGDTVEVGEPLYRVYAAYHAEMAFARQSCERDNAFSIGFADEITRLNVEF